MTLTNTLKLVWQQATMNRFTIVGSLIALGGLGSIACGIANNDLYPISAGMVSMGAGGDLLRRTKAGKSTIQSYDLTKWHYRTQGKLEPEYFLNHMDWYCDRQGMMMAAKECDQMDNYKEAEKMFKSVKKFQLPNF